MRSAVPPPAVLVLTAFAACGAAAACGGAPPEADPAAAIDSAGPPAAAAADPTVRARLARPFPLADSLGGGVGLADPGAPDVVAYVSRRHRRVYVDPDRASRVHFLLGAYTSVSTGLWRIPLPGDPRTRPIAPGDEPREFERTALAEWDRTEMPVPGDMRVRLGGAGLEDMVLTCRPLAGGAADAAQGTAPDTASVDTRVRVAALRVLRLDGAPSEGGREEFVEIGRAHLHADSGCRDEGRSVPLHGWKAATDYR